MVIIFYPIKECKVMKNNGDMVSFLKQKNYIMINNDLGGGSFGKTVLLQDPFTDELFVAKMYKPQSESIRERFFKNFIDEIKIMYKLYPRAINLSSFPKTIWNRLLKKGPSNDNIIRGNRKGNNHDPNRIQESKIFSHQINWNQSSCHKHRNNIE